MESVKSAIQSITSALTGDAASHVEGDDDSRLARETERKLNLEKQSSSSSGTTVTATDKQVRSIYIVYQSCFVLGRRCRRRGSGVAGHHISKTLY